MGSTLVVRTIVRGAVYAALVLSAPVVSLAQPASPTLTFSVAASKVAVGKSTTLRWRRRWRALRPMLLRSVPSGHIRHVWPGCRRRVSAQNNARALKGQRALRLTPSARPKSRCLSRAA